MNKEQLDEIYHQLRLLYVEDDIPQKEAILGLVSHLTESPGSGNYPALLRFLAYYGRQYLLPWVITEIKERDNEVFAPFKRVVELGSGFAWFGNGISEAFNVPSLNIDKRQWPFVNIVADVETANGLKRVLDEMQDGDLVVMCDFLHCLSSKAVADILTAFSKWPLIILERMPYSVGHYWSYEHQLRALGCKFQAACVSIERYLNRRSSQPGTVIHSRFTASHKLWIIYTKSMMNTRSI